MTIYTITNEEMQDAKYFANIDNAIAYVTHNNKYGYTAEVEMTEDGIDTEVKRKIIVHNAPSSTEDKAYFGLFGFELKDTEYYISGHELK